MLRINETKRAMLPSIVKYLLPSDTAVLSFRSILEQRQKMIKTKESFSFKDYNLCSDDFMVAQRFTGPCKNSQKLPWGFAPKVLSKIFCAGGFAPEVFTLRSFPSSCFPRRSFQVLCPKGLALEALEVFPQRSFPLCIFLEVLSMKVLSGRSYPKVFVPEVLPQRFSPGGAGGLAHEVLHQRFLRFFWVPQVLPWRFCPGGFALEVLS